MRRLGIFFVCLLSLHVAGAQEQNKEEKAKIKEIKLSGNYYFSDVTMDKAKDALELAFRNLVLTVRSELSVGKEIEPRVKEKWQHFVLLRADKQWVFAYIYKGDVDDKFVGKEKSTEQRVVVADTTAKDMETKVAAKSDNTTAGNVKDDTTVTVPVVVKADTGTQSAEQAAVASVVKADTAREVKIRRVRDTLVVVRKDTVVVHRRDTVVIKEIVKDERPASTGNAMLDRILTFKKIEDLQRYFEQKKEEGKLMFGKLNTALAPEKCYMVIFSREGNVIAILDKGAESRRNLTKGTDGDHLDNYKGQGKVWFQLY